AEPLGRRAMLVVCGRRHGLYANLTRFVYFDAPTSSERELHMATMTVEAAALSASTPGATLGRVFSAMVQAYADAGFAGAESHHHQGGPCGYLARDAVARPDSVELIQERNALAWNPSLPGAKTEDTVVTTTAGIEVLTVDPDWPMRDGPSGPRPDLLVVT
ncbi:MAG: M24 family metallopeptidase, partial [Actinomycetota bacterium]|nr:M24 family metallopeptidase [Actinomycetota bacterium]